MKIKIDIKPANTLYISFKQPKGCFFYKTLVVGYKLGIIKKNVRRKYGKYCRQI